VLATESGRCWQLVEMSNLNGERQVRVWNALATESGRCWQLVEMSHMPVIEDDQTGYDD
jgi:hypothetical protein